MPSPSRKLSTWAVVLYACILGLTMVGESALALPIQHRSGVRWKSSPSTPRSSSSGGGPSSPASGPSTPSQSGSNGHTPNPNYQYRTDTFPAGQFVGLRVKDMDPHNPNPETAKSTWIHPSVVVGGPDAQNNYKVALISNNHRDNVPTNPVKTYQPGSSVKGEISLGPPKVVNWSKMKTWKENKKGGPAPPLSPADVAKLQTDIKNVCAANGVDSGLARRGLGGACSLPRSKSRGGAAKANPKVIAKAKPKSQAPNNKGGKVATARSSLLGKKTKQKTRASPVRGKPAQRPGPPARGVKKPATPKPGAPALKGRKTAARVNRAIPRKGAAPLKNTKARPKAATVKPARTVAKHARPKVQQKAAAKKPSIKPKVKPAAPRKAAPQSRPQLKKPTNPRRTSPKPGRK